MSTGSILPLPKGRYGVAISWDRAKASVDLDLQAVIVDDHGMIVDAVFYNNLSAFNGSVGHSGDKKLADGKEYSESVWVNLTKLPKQVALIIFVVAAYGDCMLKDVTGGKISVLEDWVGYRLKESKIERAMADVDAVFMMKRSVESGWCLVEIEEPPSAGSHFLDILEPTIGDLIRKEIPGAPAVQKVTFLMDKGSAIDFQETSVLKRLVVGISGKLPRGFVGSVDIDISAVLFSQAGKIIGAVDCESDEKFGVSHSGDYVAGHSSGDDEGISIDLLQLPQKVAQIFFILNVRGGATFQSVESAYARVADQACTELARYEIVGGASENGLIIARIFRTSDKRWSLQALGMFCIAEKWQDAKDILKQLFKESPEKVDSAGDGKPLGFSRRFSAGQPPPEPGTDNSGPAGDPGTGSRSICVTARGSANSTGTDEIPMTPNFADRTWRLGSAHSMESEAYVASRVGTSRVGSTHTLESGTYAMSRMGSSRCITAATSRLFESEDSGRSVRVGAMSSYGGDDYGSRCVTAQATYAESAYDHIASLQLDPELRRSGSGEYEGVTRTRSTARMVNGRKGTIRLAAYALPPDEASNEEAEGGKKTDKRQALRFNLGVPDADVVPVDEDPAVVAAKPRGICAGGCSWASRMQLFGACGAAASSDN